MITQSKQTIAIGKHDNQWSNGKSRGRAKHNSCLEKTRLAPMDVEVGSTREDAASFPLPNPLTFDFWTSLFVSTGWARPTTHNNQVLIAHSKVSLQIVMEFPGNCIVSSFNPDTATGLELFDAKCRDCVVISGFQALYIAFYNSRINYNIMLYLLVALATWDGSRRIIITALVSMGNLWIWGHGSKAESMKEISWLSDVWECSAN